MIAFAFYFQTLKKFGAIGVYFLATHGIFSGSSMETILQNKDFIRKIVVTNTVPQASHRVKLPDILQVIDISGESDCFVLLPRKTSRPHTV